MFNSPFIVEQAARLAARAQREAGNDSAKQVERVFLLMLARLPTASESAACLSTAEKHGLATVCRALINSNEFLFFQ